MPRTTQRGVSQPTDRVMQWGDMPKESQRDVSGQMRNMGMAASGVATQRGRLEATRDRPGNLPKSAEKAGQRLSSLAALGEHLVDRPITHQAAAAHRVSLVEAGGRRAMLEGTDTGTNWYFSHHQRLSNVAHATGHSKASVIAASAVMSPQNNPEQELTAVHALAQAHANPKASMLIGREAVRREPSLEGLGGQSVHPSALTSAQLAGASAVGVREHIGTTGVDLPSISKGGVKGNVTKAIDVLRGNTAPDAAINPQTSPKVWSYHENIAKSVPGTGEQFEFDRRMRSATGRSEHGQVPGQQQMDVYPGLRSATHGPLNPTGTTAEDTWQQAISTRQKLPQQPVPGRQGRAAMQSPAKFSVGEGGQANQKFLRSPAGMTGVGPSAAMHAWQNQATIRAASTLSRKTGETIPATGVQAGGWTEARRQAGKAIEENVTPKRRARGVQGALFR